MRSLTGELLTHRGGSRAPDVEALRELVRRSESTVGIERGRREAGDRGVNPPATSEAMTCWRTALIRGVVHEWFSQCGDGWTNGSAVMARGERQRRTAAGECFPALCVLSHLCRRGVDASPDLSAVWIGRACFASVRTLAGAGAATPMAARDAVDERALLNRSIFFDPPDDAARLWAIDLAIRSPGVGVVVADGAGLDMAASRRLQLAAQARRDEADHGPLVLIARPARDLTELSAAMARWVVSPTPSPTLHPRWTVQLLRCKGMRPVTEEASRFIVEYDHATGIVDLLTDVRHGSCPASAGADTSAERRRTA